MTFGHYPQTESGNDETPIEWLVLARDGNKALLLSRYGLDAQPYHSSHSYYSAFEKVTWERCTLRAWLNKDFLNKTFSSTEQNAILMTNVDNGMSQGYWKTDGGNNTQDKIFLLSYAEANKYLGVTREDGNNMKSRVALTAYADTKVLNFSRIKTADGKIAEAWWLRSLGSIGSWAAFVRSDGSLSDDVNSNHNICIRPALWVNLDSGIF